MVRSGRVRRAKLYYLRDRKGKSARISEKIKKSIGVDVSEAPTEKEIAKVKEPAATEIKEEKLQQNIKKEKK